MSGECSGRLNGKAYLMSITETDIAIIGAGAAGLGAALTARAAGLSFHIFEAQDRTGGRAHTVSIPGGVYDLGCHYLHGGPRNLFNTIAFSNGLKPDIWRVRGEVPQALFLDGVRQSEAERQACATFYQQCFDALERDHQETSCDSVLDTTSRFYPLFQQWFAAIEGLSPEATSLEDYSTYAEVAYDWPVPSGYGALIGSLFQDLPISLCTPITEIDLTGSSALLKTSEGTVRAKSVVLTVSTAVLASGMIKITPDLPAFVNTALAGIQMGYAERVCLVMKDPAFDGDSLSTHALPTDGRLLGLWFNEGGLSSIGGYLAGDLAKDVAEEGGEAALIAYTEDAAVEILGSSLRKNICHRVSSAWTVNPFTQGAYTVAKPGGSACRSQMGEPIHGRMMIAGEAWTPDQYGTAHGAYATGSAAVVELIRAGLF